MPNTLFTTKFCKICDNILAISTDPRTGVSRFRCRSDAEHTEPMDVDRVTVLVRNYNQTQTTATELDEKNLEILLNDPTLPRILNKKCPTCEQLKLNTDYVIYTKVDSNAMRYLYICNHKHSWRN